MNAFIGKHNITQSTLATLRTALRGILETLKLDTGPRIGSRGLDCNITSVARMEDVRDRVEMVAEVSCPYPLNTIGLHLAAVQLRVTSSQATRQVTMSFSPIDKIEDTAPVRDESAWVDKYKKAFVEHQHDISQLTLVLPDDCLVVVGPPRLSHASSDSSFYPVGFPNSINISETRTVQPLKAVGSRRHIFAATNAPVQGSIGLLLFPGRNLLNAFYANATFDAGITDRNSKYNSSAISIDGVWNENLEEDIFRVPFADGSLVAGARYIEAYTLINRNTAIQSGQARIMEQASFMADRLVPWPSCDGPDEGALDAVIGSHGSLTWAAVISPDALPRRSWQTAHAAKGLPPDQKYLFTAARNCSRNSFLKQLALFCS